MTVLQPPLTYWRCPTCRQTDASYEPPHSARMHACPALNLTVPFVAVDKPDDLPDARHRVMEREDYIGTELASPIMAVRTERGEGSNDCTVFAPTARLQGA